MNIIIYGSCYGTSKLYAEELSKRTNIDFISYEKINNINSYNTIIYIGGLYAGGVYGMKKTLGKLTDCDHKNIIIATVGLADPENEENICNIRRNMRNQLTDEIYSKAHICHLRGGIDYAKLGFKHKTMMSLLYKKVIKIPEEKKNAEINALIETYNKKVSFVDFTQLDKIETHLLGI